MALIPGLFGKMPAHGDFVRRGWDDAAVAALDDWAGDAIAVLRARDLPENSGPGTPIARFWVPAGTFGDAAVHLAVARAQDRVGRDFVLAVGVAGDPAWRHAQTAGDALAAVLRAALAGACDADATLRAVAATIDAGGDDAAPEIAPDTGICWQGGAPVAVDVRDPATLADRLRERAAA